MDGNHLCRAHVHDGGSSIFRASRGDIAGRPAKYREESARTPLPAGSGESAGRGGASEGSPESASKEAFTSLQVGQAVTCIPSNKDTFEVHSGYRNAADGKLEKIHFFEGLRLRTMPNPNLR